MYEHLMAFMRPSSMEQVRLAAVPVEPQAIFVYVLLFLAAWAIWQGNRSSQSAPDSEDEKAPDGAVGVVPSPADRRREKSRKNKTKRRRQGHVNWIQ